MIKSLLIISFLFLNGTFLEELNNSERRYDLCTESNSVTDFGIPCASVFEVVFTKAKRNGAAGKKYEVEGYLVADDSFRARISDAKISVGKLTVDGRCEVTHNFKSDTNGTFKMLVDFSVSNFIQFEEVGYKSVLIEIKN